MDVKLNGTAIQPDELSVRDKREEVAGRTERTIEVTGFILTASSADAVEGRLDAVLRVASEAGSETYISLRSGRRLRVRRTAFTKDVSPEKRAGAFTLAFRAETPFEESEEPEEVSWAVAGSGAERNFEPGGTVYTEPVISLTPSGTLVNPGFSDGERAIQYDGLVEADATLVFDGEALRVTLDGEDVTPYTQGEFPRLGPEATGLAYMDDTATPCTTQVTVAYRSRWW